MIKNLIRKIIKKYWGIDGISLFVKKQKKKLMKKIYRKKYTTDDLISTMCKMGMKKGSVVFIHSAMTEFYNYKGTAVELIEGIINVIGDKGTLMMPAYPKDKKKLFKIASESDKVVFDVNNTPSGAGYLSEVFRTYPGVKRSINLQHSVCARGRLADYFVSEHHLSNIAWDEYSPYYKLAMNQEAIIYCLGLEPYLRNVTLIHCTETILRDKYEYFSSFFGKVIKYRFLDQNNNLGFHEMVLNTKSGVRSEKVVKLFFDKLKYKRRMLSNLKIETVESNYMYKACIELADKGISIYKEPSAKKYLINGKFLKKK